MMQIIRRTPDLETAWSKQYVNLAHVFARMLPTRCRRVAEIGCGRGQLTIPLAIDAKNLRFVLVDRFVGTNYSKNHEALTRNLAKTRLKSRVHIAVSDYMKWFKTQNDNAYDAVISSEFIPEIDADDTHPFIQECYRILKRGGVTIHSFLSPTSRNFRQKLLITADSNPLWTYTPPKEWFSPEPQLVVRELRKSGFHRTRKYTLRARLIMRADAAKSWLKNAEVRARFFEKHRKLLREEGLEVPDWVIVSGVK